MGTLVNTSEFEFVDAAGKTIILGDRVGIAFRNSTRAHIRTGIVKERLPGSFPSVIVTWDENGKDSPAVTFRSERFVVLDR